MLATKPEQPGDEVQRGRQRHRALRAQGAVWRGRELVADPKGNWYLGMRIYRPGETVLSGAYTIPQPTEIK